MPQNRTRDALSTPLDFDDPEDGSESMFDVAAALRALEALKSVRHHLKTDRGEPGVKHRKSSKLEMPRYRNNWSSPRLCDACARPTRPWNLTMVRESEGALDVQLCVSCHESWLRLDVGYDNALVVERARLRHKAGRASA